MTRKQATNETKGETMNEKTKQFVKEQTAGMNEKKAAQRIKTLIHCSISEARQLLAEAKS